ncbi:alpha-1-antiproteinase-like [Paramacrobiotus metropolitanus]|uniref:alpha-1-antiproteinase-like n=1 Tax=Paramacrobiotus metropolitanus TaxID=2943436 RepID=UPI002445D106|nr:alpha-1-antiproteinase-like [Paramacrobiotus metropolitanus]
MACRKLCENRVRFSLTLYKTVLAHISSSENLLISPLSAELAAIAAYIGAEGKTRSEIAQVLGLTADYTVEDISGRLAQIICDETREVAFNPENCCKNFELSSCVGIFIDENVRLNEHYAERAQNLVKAVCLPVRFASDPGSAWENVRGFVAAHSKGKGPEILELPKFTRPSKLVFATTINFHSNWEEHFPGNCTVKKCFTLITGAKIQVDTMHGRFIRLFKYYKSKKFHGAKILQLPYLGNYCKAYFILPRKKTLFSCPVRKDRLSQLEDLLTPKRLLEEMGKVDFPHVVTAEIPKFCLNYTMAVEQFLSEMGMPTAFSDVADLSGICPLSPLKISTITQTAVFEIDETGTDSCPVTVDRAAFMSRSPTNRVKFIANRPFLFIVCHEATSTIIFMGRICNPLT